MSTRCKICGHDDDICCCRKKKINDDGFPSLTFVFKPKVSSGGHSVTIIGGLDIPTARAVLPSLRKELLHCGGKVEECKDNSAKIMLQGLHTDTGKITSHIENVKSTVLDKTGEVL